MDAQGRDGLTLGAGAVLAVVLLALVLLGGCSFTIGPKVERETIWARKGTAGRVADKREIEVLVPDGAGGWKRSRAQCDGMCLIDEPTLTYYRDLHQKHGKAEDSMVDNSENVKAIESAK
jgi:hypothetical protein